MMNPEITNILKLWTEKKVITDAEIKYLLTEESNDLQLKKAWNTNKNSLIERANLFIEVVDEIIILLNQLKFPHPEACVNILWNFWLPLAIKLVNWRKNQQYPLIQGILGGQGTGKTTLTTVLHLLLAKMGYSSIGISIDDLYKTYAERQELLMKDERLKWRGPPGTHDIQLGIEILDNLRLSQNQVAIPRFDKSLHRGQGDRIKPELVKNVDIILFEGWFLGAIPVKETAFINPPFPIIKKDDIQFAKDMNENLKEYLPLWERLDHLIILYPQDYRWSLEWRKDAEHKMIASGKSGMTDSEIEEFVYYFWRSLHPELFITPLTKNKQSTDLVIEIKKDHSLGSIYSP